MNYCFGDSNISTVLVFHENIAPQLQKNCFEMNPLRFKDITVTAHKHEKICTLFI